MIPDRHKTASTTSRLYPDDIINLILPMILEAGNTKGGSITVPLTSYLTGLESAV
jgi:hypothetical protein